MPLFMFLSGIFAYKDFKEWNKYESFSFLKKKTIRIIIPFITIGGLYSFLFCSNWYDVYSGKNTNYWFLPTLFYCMCITLVINLIFNNYIKSRCFNKEFAYHTLCWLILILLYKVFNNFIPYYLHTIKMLPFFIFGTYYSKYEVIKANIVSSKLTIFISIIIYVICFVHSDKLPNNLNYKGLFAIPILVYLSFMFKDKNNKALIYIGKYSLEIYVFHWYILAIFPPINHIFSLNIINNFIPLAILTFTISIPIIYISIIISNIIRRNKFISNICFGDNN